MKNSICFWLLLTTVLYVSEIAPAAQNAKTILVGKQSKADAVDDFIKLQMQQLHIPGLSLVVRQNGKTIKSSGYGLANVELNVPATPDTIYEIGSVTKQFTGTAVMMLVEENKIKLDDSIGNYLTDIPDAWKPITVRQLQNQTSGLKDYTDAPDFAVAALAPANKKQILQPVANLPLSYKPGDAYNYSNTNHFLLGLLIEKASGNTYANFLQERIFTRLGMTETRVNDYRRVLPNRSSGYNYDWSKNVVENTDYWNPAWTFAAGALVSTVNDLAKWDAALYTDKLISSNSKKEMWTAGRLASGVPHRYGFGWYVDKVNGHLNLSHGGDIPGFATYYSRYPDDRLTIIISLNQYIYPKRMADKIAAIYLPSLVYRPIADKDLAFTALVQKLYANRANGKADFWAEQLFTTELWKWLEVSLFESGNIEFYKRLGAAKSIELVERIEDEQGLLTRYRFTYGTTARLIKFVRNSAGKITEWEDYEE